MTMTCTSIQDKYKTCVELLGREAEALGKVSFMSWREAQAMSNQPELIEFSSPHGGRARRFLDKLQVEGGQTEMPTEGSQNFSEERHEVEEIV